MVFKFTQKIFGGGGNGLTRGSGPTRKVHAPTRESAFRGVVPVGGQSLGTCQAHSAAPHQRQRKEEKVHSVSTKTPAPGNGLTKGSDPTSIHP